MSPELVSAAWTAGITVFVLFVAGVGVGFSVIAKRKSAAPRTDRLGELQQRANILLVRVDDAVKSAEDELGFAVAQFGDERTQDFESALATAKSQLAEAFSIQQKLDDVEQDSQIKRREWSARIIHLCETAQSELETREREFAELRVQEKNAPASLDAVNALLDSIDDRLPASIQTLRTLADTHAASALATVTENVDRAKKELGLARTATAKAQQSISGAGGPAGDDIHAAQVHAKRAQQLLDAVDTLKVELSKAVAAVAALQAATQQNLSEARALRESAPDADTAAEVGSAIQTVEASLAAKDPLSDPLESLEILRAANAELDNSMASARNQQRRLDGAATALTGALVAARSQLAATRDFITTRRGGVGAEARTRIAEAERLLALAEAEADPIAALDIARSSTTYSRDADALARYDLVQRS